MKIWLMLSISVIALNLSPLARADIDPGAPHPLGALPPTTTVPAPIPAAGASATLPESVDLTAWAVPVGDQGYIGSCVAWTIAHAMLGWYANREGVQPTLFAPMYMYSQINVGKDQGYDGGSRPLVLKHINNETGIMLSNIHKIGSVVV